MSLIWFRRKKDDAQDTLDLRGSTPKKNGFGSPQPCPVCGGPGMLDRIDVRHRVQHQHCMRCDELYSITEGDFAFMQSGKQSGKKFDQGTANARAVAVKNEPAE